MTSAFLLSALLTGAGPIPAPQATPLASGIYLERPASAGEPSPQQMRSTTMENARSSGGMKMMFGGKPAIVMTLSGAAAELRLDTPDPAFRIVLNPRKLTRGEMPDFSDLSRDAPPPMAKEGKEFNLVKLAIKDGGRELDSKKGKVAVSVEKVADHVYRVKPSKPLEPGEYALVWEISGMPTGQVWDFAVQQH
jgi:hypothetical protein